MGDLIAFLTVFFKHVSIPLYLIVPAVGAIVLYFVKTLPGIFLQPFGYKEIYIGGSDRTGPYLKDLHIERLKALKEKREVVASAKTSTEFILSKIYDQNSLHIRGFNRALLIAVIYPIVLLFASWVFSNGGVDIGGVANLPGLVWYLKLGLFLLLITPVVVAHTWGNARRMIVSVFQKCKFNNLATYCLWLLIVAAGVAVAGVVVFVAAEALPFARSGPGVGAFTVIFAGSGGFTVAAALVGVVAFSAVGVGAVVVASAVAAAFPFFSSGVGAFTASLAVYIVAAVYVIHTYLLLSSKTSSRSQIYAIGLLFAVGLISLTLPVWSEFIHPTNKTAFAGYYPAWIVSFYFVVLPLVNALSDWVSVSITQFCLRQYKPTKANWLPWLLVDLFTAFFMLFLVFVSIFAILNFSELCGWQVNAQRVLEQFKEDPFSTKNAWLVLLVVTNLVPTLIHFVLIVYGHFSGWFFSVNKRFDILLEKYKLAQQLTPNQKLECAASDYTWSHSEAREVAEYLTGVPVLWALFVVTLVIPFAYGIYRIITQLLFDVIGWVF